MNTKSFPIRKLDLDVVEKHARITVQHINLIVWPPSSSWSFIKERTID